MQLWTNTHALLPGLSARRTGSTGPRSFRGRGRSWRSRRWSRDSSSAPWPSAFAWTESRPENFFVCLSRSRGLDLQQSNPHQPSFWGSIGYFWIKKNPRTSNQSFWFLNHKLFHTDHAMTGDAINSNQPLYQTCRGSISSALPVCKVHFVVPLKSPKINSPTTK